MRTPWLGLLLLCAACRHPYASGGPPKDGIVPSTACDGRAQVDPAIQHVPGVRASWFNDPTGHERLYVLEAGPPRAQAKHPPLVLIHGVGAIGTADFYPALAHLSRERHVLAIDLPGFGRSNPEDKDFGPERLARSVDTVVRVCAPGEIDVLGHSSGGSLAVLYAAKRADVVRRLVLADVAGILRPEILLHGQLHSGLTNMHDHVPHLANAVEKTGAVMIKAISVLVPSAEAAADSGLLGQSPGVLAASALLDFNFGPAIQGVRAPTLILWGKEDHVVPTRIERLLHARITPSEVIYLPGSGHVPMKDQPEEMAMQVGNFLDGKPPKAEPPPPLPAPERLQDGACNGQDDQTFAGDYDEIVIERCKNVQLLNVRARHVIVRKSDGQLDNCEISDGLVADDSDLIVTGGVITGLVGVAGTKSELDLAGVELSGTRAALSADAKSKVVLSVTHVKSPQRDAMMHEDLKRDDAYEL